MSTNILDIAWGEINALGGTPCCAHDHVYNAAIRDALRIVERLGGCDPLRNPLLRVPDRVIPLARLDARCPDCARPLDDAEIDGGYCGRCEAAAFVRQSARRDALQGDDGPEAA